MENRQAYVHIADMFGTKNVVKSSKSSGGFAPRKPKVQPRSGSTCDTCFEKRSVTGLCSCNAF